MDIKLQETKMEEEQLNPDEMPDDRWKAWGRKYFEVVQKLFDDILFYVDIKEKRLTHIDHRAEGEGDIILQYNFPADIIEGNVIHPEDIEIAKKFGDDLLNGIEDKIEIRLIQGEGQYEWFEIRSLLIYNENGEAFEAIGRFSNIQLQKDMEIKARIDSLTKTQNRMAFEENVKRTLEEATLNQSHALLFIDLDDFKSINDNHGHIYGDFVLSEVSKRLLKGVQTTDYVGRVGGDEFVILMKNLQDPNVVQARADQLLDDIRKEICGEVLCLKVQASIGVARYPMDGFCYQELYEKADQALYQSKALGKNVATLYTENLMRPKELPPRKEKGYTLITDCDEMS